MRAPRWLSVSVLAIAIVAISAGTYLLMRRPASEEPAQWVEGYSGELSYTDFRDPSKSYHGKVFSNILSRMREFRIDKIFPNRTRIEIWRQDPSTFLVLDPDAKTYWIPTMRAALRISEPGPEAPLGVKRLVGRERLNGRWADHWEVTNIRGVVEEYWEDVRLRVVLKSVKPGASTYELTNVDEGRQRDELFMVPQGYKEVAREVGSQ